MCVCVRARAHVCTYLCVCGWCVPPPIDAQQRTVCVRDVKSDELWMLQSHAESPEAAGWNDLEEPTFELNLANIVAPPMSPHLLIYRITIHINQYSAKMRIMSPLTSQPSPTPTAPSDLK